VSHIEVRLYATLSRHLAGYQSGDLLELEIVDGMTVLQLLADVLDVPLGEVRTIFVNGVSKRADWPLRDGDRVGIFPSVAGG